MTMDGGFDDDCDDLLNSSLTNLQWLQHINMNLNEGLGVPRKTVASSSYNSTTSPVNTKEDRQRSGVDYSRNSLIKPPYSYATLICMAIRETAKHKITLSAIYNWIMANFAYYRNADPSWQNSIRHNLSLNKCFMKVPRDKDEPGKGGFWMINSEYEEYFKNGVFKRRKSKKKIQKAPYTKSGSVYRMNVYNPGRVRTKPVDHSTIEICSNPNNLVRINSTPISIPSPLQDHRHQPLQDHRHHHTNSHQRHCQNTDHRGQNQATENRIRTVNCENRSQPIINSDHRGSNLNLGHHNSSNSHQPSVVLTSTPQQQQPAVLTSTPINNSNVVVDDQPWELVLKDIQLNSGNIDTEVVRRNEDDFFKDSGLNLESLNEDLTTPELNELFRDIENLIDMPTLKEPELIVKGEKLSSVSLDTMTSNTWGNIMDELNIGGISDYLDSPLNGLV